MRGLFDALDLGGAEPQVTAPDPAAQVLAQPRAAEHVDVPDGGHVPGDLRPVHGHRRPDRDAAAQLAGQQPGRLVCLPLRVREPVPHVVRPVPQLAVAARPHRQPPVPVLGVDGEHARRADHQVVDLLDAVRDGQAVHGPVALAFQAGQLPRRALLGPGQPDSRRAAERGPGPVDGVGDGGEHGQGQPPPPVVQQEPGDQPDDDRDDRAPLPGPHPRTVRQVRQVTQMLADTLGPRAPGAGAVGRWLPVRVTDRGDHGLPRRCRLGIDVRHGVVRGPVVGYPVAVIVQAGRLGDPDPALPERRTRGIDVLRARRLARAARRLARAARSLTRAALRLRGGLRLLRGGRRLARAGHRLGSRGGGLGPGPAPPGARGLRAGPVRCGPTLRG